MSSLFYNTSQDFATLNPHTESPIMKLDDTNITKFKVAKEFSENKARINSIDFSHDGKNLISSSDDDNIILYDCEKGTKKRDIMSHKYGADLIRYTHASNTAIHTSNKLNDTIRYLSLHDNKYLRYFVGHSERVVTLSMSPADDQFISGSEDKTIRLWDLKSDKHIGILKDLESPPIANYDPEGLVFAVGMKSEIIKLYDSRQYSKGPFNTIKCVRPLDSKLTWKSLKFSPNGKQILITSDMEELFILDAFSGQPLQKLTFGSSPITTPLKHPCEASYTPDSQYILCGGVDGSIHVWSANKGTKVAQLKPTRTNPEPVQCLMFNPKYMLMASGCSKMSFWIPTHPEPMKDSPTI